MRSIPTLTLLALTSFSLVFFSPTVIATKAEKDCDHVDDLAQISYPSHLIVNITKDSKDGKVCRFDVRQPPGQEAFMMFSVIMNDFSFVVDPIVENLSPWAIEDGVGEKIESELISQRESIEQCFSEVFNINNFDYFWTEGNVTCQGLENISALSISVNVGPIHSETLYHTR